MALHKCDKLHACLGPQRISELPGFGGTLCGGVYILLRGTVPGSDGVQNSPEPVELTGHDQLAVLVPHAAQAFLHEGFQNLDVLADPYRAALLRKTKNAIRTQARCHSVMRCSCAWVGGYLNAF